MSDHNMISAEQAKALLSGITPGPWWFIECEYRGTLVRGAGLSMRLGHGYVKDAELAAAAPDLARTVIAQEEQIKRLQNAVMLMTHTSRLYLLENLYEDQVLTTQDMEKNND